MPLKKILLKPGVNKENTRYTNENGWYVSENVRFRQGTPEKIGGWQRISPYTFQGVCRLLWNWVTLGFENLLAVGTNLKFYIERGGAYYDITPIRRTVTLTNPFTTNTTAGTANQVLVTDNAHGCKDGDFVTFSGASAVGGIPADELNANHQIDNVTTNTYTITVATNASSIATGGGTVVAKYEINISSAIQGSIIGWGSGPWGGGPWGIGVPGTERLRLWSAQNWGEDLVFGVRGKEIYYWDATNGVTTRGVALNSLGGDVTFTSASPTVVTFASVLLSEGTAVKFNFETGGSIPSGVTAGTTYYLRNVDGATANISASPAGALVNTASTGANVYVSELVDVPSKQNGLIISDTSRFLLLFGATAYGSAVLDPMLIRWGDQESVVDWIPAVTNQAGSLRLSHGSQIISQLQTRQEIVVWTDSALYSIQYLGPPFVWGSQLLADNISIVSANAVAVASGVVYWMGIDKFYTYNGRTQTLRCDLRRYIFSDINASQYEQIFAGTNEGFNEVWWFYCSANSTEVNKYVVYNYAEDIWYYGNMSRSAWIDSGLRYYPEAATYNYNIVDHEYGVDDLAAETPAPIEAYIESAEFDIEDGQNFGFVWRMVPDLTFQGSTAQNPQVTMTLYGMNGSGSGFNTEAAKAVARTSTVTIEQFTNIIYTRIRGRQMIMRVGSNGLGTTWQLGAPRIDIKVDGQR
jgi:hypothetical protein